MAALLLFLFAAACSGVTGGGEPPSEDFNDAALEYARCMRDKGFDVPDPEIINGDGGAEIRLGTGDGIDPDDEEFRAAEEACVDELGGHEVGMLEHDPEEQREFEEAALAYAHCMREQGIDMPDPDFEPSTDVASSEDGELPDAFSDEFQEADEACRDLAPDGADLHRDVQGAGDGS